MNNNILNDDIDKNEASEQEDDSAEQLLNEWLGELDTLTGSLEAASNSTSHLRPLATNELISTPRMDSYRFSMANLEESQDVDLDAILGELCALENQCDQEIGRVTSQAQFKDEIKRQQQSILQHHYRSCSDGTRPIISNEEFNDLLKTRSSARTESPDNDSAFSDTVSMLSSESSTSSGFCAGTKLGPNSNSVNKDQNRDKAEKIRLALEKMKEASIKKLFIKVFMSDGATKSLLVDEKMTTGYVIRLLADKNHVRMDPKWSIVENIPELFMERIYEDHEMLVENLLQWSRDSKNKIIFCEKYEKVQMFDKPENFLLSASEDYCQSPRSNSSTNFDFDENSRNVLLNEFFSVNSNNVPEVEGPLYLKSDSKKGWKKYYFVLRASGIYYCSKEKSKTNAKDLTCLAKFDTNHAYYGIGWKKKFKAPTDYCFAIKDYRLNEPKSFKYIKYLCAESPMSLQRWMTGIRVAKHGRKILVNYRNLIDELAQEDIEILANARSCSISSIAMNNSSNMCTAIGVSNSSMISYSSSGRHSRASSSSSSGCMSDSVSSENGFESEFPMGTIKRKPSMKPCLPLTNVTRQLIEIGQISNEFDTDLQQSHCYGTNTGTLTRKHSRRKSSGTDDSSSSNSSTLKRHFKMRNSLENSIISSINSSSSGNSTPVIRTPTKEISSSDFLANHVNEIIADDNLEEIQSTTNEMLKLSISLDSLPPPPAPGELPAISESQLNLSGSQISLMSLPPPPTPPSESEPSDDNEEETGTVKRRPKPIENIRSMISEVPEIPIKKTIDEMDHSDEQINDLFAESPKIIKNCLRSSLRSNNSCNSVNGTTKLLQRKVSFQNESVHIGNSYSVAINSNGLSDVKKSIMKKTSASSMYDNMAVNNNNNKPEPPKRSEHTKLTSPKKFENSLTAPPKEFIRDLQKVMKKKWQIAQKCQLNQLDTPYEVLGFRDPPSFYYDAYYKETNVSNWVQEHYGGNADNFYENIDQVVQSSNTVVNSSTAYHPKSQIFHSPYHYADSNPKVIKRLPPPPPKRSESTHLTSKT